MLIASAIALGVIAISCGGGAKGTKTATAIPTLGPVTPLGTASPALQQYFQQAQALDSQATQRLDAINGMLENPPSGADQQLKVLGDYLTDLIAIDRDLASGLQQLTPPPEAKDAQQGAIDALNSVIGVAQDAGKAGPELTDVIAAVSSPKARNANNQLSQACENLNRVAEAYGLSAKLDCGQ